MPNANANPMPPLSRRSSRRIKVVMINGVIIAPMIRGAMPKLPKIQRLLSFEPWSK